MLRDPILNRIGIEGEISNLKIHSSQHAYFTLKEGDAKISCVMFNAAPIMKTLALEDGHKVICHGYISIYERDGKYQLYVKDIEKVGLGALYEAYEALKKRLSAEGYFDESRKKAIPKYPQKVAMITSPTGSVIRDMLKVSARRNHMTDVCLIPAAVQGENAPEDIVNAIEKANALPGCDVIILARGGGSIEELWAFNDPRVAEAIFKSRLPIVSAIGHETDFTISDFVSDLRAATPSEAAERIFFDTTLLKRELDGIAYLSEAAIMRQFKVIENILSQHNPLKIYGRIIAEYDQKKLTLEHYKNKIFHSVTQDLAQKRHQIQEDAATLHTLSPLSTLDRGYAIATNVKGQVISSIRETAPGDVLSIRLKDGSINTKVDAIYKENVNG